MILTHPREAHCRCAHVLTVLLALVVVLRPQPNACAAVPDGLYFEANDHFQSPSEPLQFTYQATAADLPELQRGIDFVVSDLTGAVIAKGTSTDVRPENDLAICTLLPADRIKGWKEGWYDLLVTPAQSGQTPAASFKIKVHFLARYGAARVVYLLDNSTPEGYAEWLNTSSR